MGNTAFWIPNNKTGRFVVVGNVLTIQLFKGKRRQGGVLIVLSHRGMAGAEVDLVRLGNGGRL
jgi:hypothetical protein